MTKVDALLPLIAYAMSQKVLPFGGFWYCIVMTWLIQPEIFIHGVNIIDAAALLLLDDLKSQARCRELLSRRPVAGGRGRPFLCSWCLNSPEPSQGVYALNIACRFKGRYF